MMRHVRVVLAGACRLTFKASMALTMLMTFIPIPVYGAGSPVPGNGSVSIASPASPASSSTPSPSDCINLSLGVLHGISSWKDLHDPVYLTPNKEVVYYTFSTINGSRAHLVVADYKSGKYVFKPVVTLLKTPVSITADQEHAIAAVNAAYFNLSDGLSVGYIYADGRMVADPQVNLALYENKKLKPFLPAVFNRTELRFLKNEHKETEIQIAPHIAPLPTGCKLVDSLQAGPRLLPEITEEQEAFVRKDPESGLVVDAINSHRDAARTAFGITNDGYALMLCVASPRQNRESAGVTLVELAEILKRLGCVEAINFDGGASTTMAVDFPKESSESELHSAAGSDRITVVCGKEPETRVKSVLMLMKNQ